MSSGSETSPPDPEALSPDWSPMLECLLAGEHLSRAEAREAMESMLSGRATSAQMSALLVALRAKGSASDKGTATDELLGFLEVMQSAAVRVPLDAVKLKVVDTCGTGGDRLGTFNVSTVAAIVVAGAGVKVCKHGNRAVSSASGSADVLECLGINLDMTPEQIAECVQQVGIGFCFAPNFHPAMRFVGPTRKEIAIPTVFNFLGPLANPAGVNRQIVGTSDPGMAEPLAQVLKQQGHAHAMVVCGADGMDEISIAGPTSVCHLKDGELRNYVIDPGEFGLGGGSPDELRGGVASANAEMAHSILGGAKGAARSIVILNAAAALVVADCVAELAEGVEAAEASIDSGQASAVLEQWQKYSQSTQGGSS